MLSRNYRGTLKSPGVGPCGYKANLRRPPDQRRHHTNIISPRFAQKEHFVSDDDPITITAIIDWQSAAIEPAFWYADEIPDFAKPIPHPSLDDQLEPNSERCAKAFDVCTQFLVPTLAGPRLMDEALIRPFRYCYRTWRDGAVAFRHELIETAQRWKGLGLAGSCPFPTPAPKELVVHQKAYQRFVAAQELRSSLSSLHNTASDGWAPPETGKPWRRPTRKCSTVCCRLC